MDKTHFRKAFDSPYLSSADIIEPTVLTVDHVKLEIDHTKKSKDFFNTAYFAEKEIRAGEKLKPMILNAMNSKTMRNTTGSPFIDDWKNVRVMVFVDRNVKFGRDIVEGLRLSPHTEQKQALTPQHVRAWNNAKEAFRRDGNLKAVLERRAMSEEDQLQLIAECEVDNQEGSGNDLP